MYDCWSFIKYRLCCWEQTVGCTFHLDKEDPPLIIVNMLYRTVGILYFIQNTDLEILNLFLFHPYCLSIFCLLLKDLKSKTCPWYSVVWALVHLIFIEIIWPHPEVMVFCHLDFTFKLLIPYWKSQRTFGFNWVHLYVSPYFFFFFLLVLWYWINIWYLV